ncbi:phosphotransferase [Streptomyces sp. NBC_01498]|uniref:phosphotransferase n=1 Tax=Streptomyces sp. NBC_01498 TaxID=2975870 RepID=UPI002E7B33CB|nr:phosphotransferase [Streptomyces sp. NBC_01498]WTL24944.1 phosphotransferase [Streptomyces sp. NBC_01498]
MDETPLPGGFIDRVVRVGDTVRRSSTVPEHRAAYVRQLLTDFEERGWHGAPRFRGVDERGREVLDHIEGLTDLPVSDARLVRVAELVREFHDLTAGSSPGGWHQVVCHNDLSPRNTVYAAPDGGEPLPVALIDWDLAAPGERIHDVAQLCWRFLDLGPRVPDVAYAARRITLVCDAYGLDDRDGIVRTILWWQDRSWRGIEAAAERGDPAMVELRARGVVDEIRAAYTWVSAHAFALASQL